MKAAHKTSNKKIREDVLPVIFSEQTVREARQNGEEDLLCEFANLYLMVKMEERSCENTTNISDNVSVVMQNQSHFRFTFDNFKSVCAKLGLQNPLVVDALFQSVDEEVDGMISADQLLKWMKTLFCICNTSEVSDKDGQSLASLAFRFIDFGHSGRLQLRSITKTIVSIFRAIALVEIPKKLITKYVTSVLSSTKVNVQATKHVTLNEKSELISEGKESGEKWRSVALHTSPKRERQTVWSHESYKLYVSSHPPIDCYSINRIPRFHVAGIIDGKSTTAKLPDESIRLCNKIVSRIKTFVWNLSSITVILCRTPNLFLVILILSIL